MARRVDAALELLDRQLTRLVHCQDHGIPGADDAAQ
jgi:hypothetical protein